MNNKYTCICHCTQTQGATRSAVMLLQVFKQPLMTVKRSCRERETAVTNQQLQQTLGDAFTLYSGTPGAIILWEGSNSVRKHYKPSYEWLFGLVYTYYSNIHVVV